MTKQISTVTMKELADKHCKPHNPKPVKKQLSEAQRAAMDAINTASAKHIARDVARSNANNSSSRQAAIEAQAKRNAEFLKTHEDDFDKPVITQFSKPLVWHSDHS